MVLGLPALLMYLKTLNFVTTGSYIAIAILHNIRLILIKVYNIYNVYNHYDQCLKMLINTFYMLYLVTDGNGAIIFLSIHCVK